MSELPARMRLPPGVAYGPWVDAFRPLIPALPPRIALSFDSAPNLSGAIPDCLPDLIALLTRNAVEAMPRGGPLDIFLGEQSLPDDDGGSARRHVMLRIKDAGLGMTPLMLERIFDSAPLENGWGSHLVERLRKARRIARLHGGKFFVDSALGYGTRVEAYLPYSPTALRTRHGVSPTHRINAT